MDSARTPRASPSVHAAVNLECSSRDSTAAVSGRGRFHCVRRTGLVGAGDRPRRETAC
jgi:hypothetical protein